MKNFISELSINRLQKGFREKQFTPLDITKYALKNAKRRPEIFTQVCENGALFQAEASTQRWQNNTPISDLDGIPFGIKDLFDIDGYATTRGSKLYKTPAHTSAPQVLDLINSGAILIGKTNLSEFAYSGLGLNPHFGTPTQKVHSKTYITGGSSSGSAAAVLENIVSFALGTDTAGSIRIPASYCGLVGFRSSRARYNNEGIAPLAPSFDTTGPICRSVKEAYLIDTILSTENSYQQQLITPLTIVVDDAFCHQLPLDTATKEAFFTSLDTLRSQGVNIENRQLSTLRETRELITDVGWLGSIEAYTSYQHLLEDEYLSQIDPFVAQRLKHSNTLSAIDTSYLYQHRETLQKQLQKELNGSLFLIPTTLTTAPLLSDVSQSVESFNKHNLNALYLTMIGSYLDCPGIALPNNLNLEGMPTSLLLSQCSGNDTMLLRHALTIEQLITKSFFNQTKGNHHG